MSLLQLRFSLGKDGGARVQAAGGRRKGRGPFAVLFVIIIASAVGGFALSQWLTENERISRNILQHELQDRVDQITRTANQLEQTRAGVRAEIEAGILRKLGTDGVVVMATVGPCRPSLVVSPPGTTTPPGVTSEPLSPPQRYAPNPRRAQSLCVRRFRTPPRSPKSSCTHARSSPTRPGVPAASWPARKAARRVSQKSTWKLRRRPEASRSARASPTGPPSMREWPGWWSATDCSRRSDEDVLIRRRPLFRQVVDFAAPYRYGIEVESNVHVGGRMAPRSAA